MNLFSVTLVLFLIMDPIGNTTSYLNLVNGLPKKRKAWVVLREMLIALCFMIAFNYIGEYIFSILNLSETAVRLSSGVILFLIALKILFPAHDSIRANLPKGEPFIIPLAVPLIAGPSLLATIMLYAHLEPSEPLMLASIGLAWIAAVGVLLLAEPLERILGKNGLMACERLMGMVLVLIAVQRFLEGIIMFYQNNA